MPEPSILDERLAEIDRRLRVIQSGLVSVEEPEPDEPVAAEQSPPAAEPFVAPPPTPTVLRAAPTPPAHDAPGHPAPPPAPRFAAAPDVTERLAELAEAHERLLELHRELLSQYAEVLERRAGETATIAVTAGPFSTAAAVREFERALATLPGVSGVVVREYPGGDKVQLEVRLTSS